MKFKLMVVFLVLFSFVIVSGCAIKGPMPPAGVLLTKVKAPESASTLALRTGNMDKVGTSKRGAASATAVLGLFSTGDASIQAAMENGRITKVHHVDYDKTLVLGGLFHQLTTIVYGE
ncbi:MAG: TRL-like family protein [Thermodesulfobacteriota bacterium]|nr:TRL-like family protein [Thermodesulfobacteriota bacterium]